MNSKKMVKLSNAIAFYSAWALVYWIILFITANVFGLSIFKGYTAAILYFTIRGIVVLMVGALILNIMFNLSRMADKTEESSPKKDKLHMIIFLATLPALVCLLFFGNFLSAKNIEKNLNKSADEIAETYAPELTRISRYAFTKEWINNAANVLKIMEKTDQNFNDVYVVLPDEINKTKTFLTFDAKGISMDRAVTLDKIDYIEKTTPQERAYFESVFDGEYTERFFSSKDPYRYEYYKLFVPIFEENDRIIILVLGHTK
jgi:nitrogen fixation/metabolism regulation signal transduction histidine kinase